MSVEVWVKSAIMVSVVLPLAFSGMKTVTGGHMPEVVALLPRARQARPPVPPGHAAPALAGGGAAACHLGPPSGANPTPGHSGGGGGGKDAKKPHPAELFRKVKQGNYDDCELRRAWHNFQHQASQRLGVNVRNGKRFRVLVATYVPDDPSSAKRWDDNFHTLSGNKAGDAFSFAIFHIDSSWSHWEALDWYASPAVVLRHKGPGCQANWWHMLRASFVEPYDYVWLCDGDLHLGFFSWDIYRQVLALLQPLVTQPTIVPGSPADNRPGSGVGGLNMEGVKLGGEMVLAREVYRTEIMTPILSTRVWPGVSSRLDNHDLRDGFFMDAVWDIPGLFNRHGCNGTGIIVVDASPVRHMHTLLIGKMKKKGISQCTSGGGVGNNRNMTKATQALLGGALPCEGGKKLLRTVWDRWPTPGELTSYMKERAPRLRQWTLASLGAKAPMDAEPGAP